ncbi:hypothetical protein PMIN04_000299 [Paraphaeosphaeria minitans]
MSERDQISRRPQGKIASTVTICNITKTNAEKGEKNAAIPDGQDHNKNTSQNTLVANTDTPNTTLPRNATDAEYFEASLQYLESIAPDSTVLRAAKRTVPSSLPSQPNHPAEYEDAAGLETGPHGANDVHSQETADIFTADPATQDAFICQVCQTTLRGRSNKSNHAKTQTHQRRLAEHLGRPVPVPAAGSKVAKHKKRREWTVEEDESILRAWFEMKKDGEIVDMFPDRSRSAVTKRRMAHTSPRLAASGRWELSGLYHRIAAEYDNPQRGKFAA